MIPMLKNQGIDEKTISIVVIIITCFMVLFGLGMVAVAIIETLNGQALAPWVAAALTLVVSFGGTLLAGHATVAQIDGSATKAAAGVVTAMQAAGTGANTAALIANTAATQASTATAANTADTAANTIATQANTIATQANTIHDQGTHIIPPTS